MNKDLVTVTGACLLIRTMAESPQIELHFQSPLAMKGPTPVSASIHVATTITAGMYLLMGASLLIEYSSTVSILCI